MPIAAETGFRPDIAHTQPFRPASYVAESAVRPETVGSVIRRNQVADALTGARDIFVASERGKRKQVVAYELDQDRAVYRELFQKRGQEGYQEARDSLNAYTKMQVETTLGERLHVGISKFKFRVVEGELLPENDSESMISMMRRGRDYRREHGSSVDWGRESAEVYGFEETQRILADPETPIGTMVLSISPQGDVKKGSIYKQNFYDIYQKVDDGVKAYRFTSGLTREESQDKVKQFDERYNRPEVPNDAQFLSRPIRLDPNASRFKTPQELHAYLHREHAYMDAKDFAVVTQTCSNLVMSYINTLCNNPDSLELERQFNVILNAADEIAESVATGKLQGKDSGDAKSIRPWIPSADEYYRLAEKQVREVATGCGLSGGSKTFSVAEFAPGVLTPGARMNKEDFNCPRCNIKTKEVQGNSCKNCGYTKKEAADAGGLSCE